MRRSRRNEGGFTLVEVLVAFAIASFSVAAFLHLFGDSRRASGTATDYDAAVRLARNLLIEQPGFREPEVLPEDQVLVLDDGETAPGFTWRLEAAHFGTEKDREAWRFHAITLTSVVQLPGGGEVSLSRLRIIPKQVDP